MRVQASLDAIIAVIIILTITSIVASIFIQNKEEVRSLSEFFRAKDTCWSIRNAMISARKPGMSIKLELPRIPDVDYYLQFTDDYLEITMENGFACALPDVVYNSTGASNFRVYSKTIVIRNIDGSLVV